MHSLFKPNTKTSTTSEVSIDVPFSVPLRF